MAREADREIREEHDHADHQEQAGEIAQRHDARLVTGNGLGRSLCLLRPGIGSRPDRSRRLAAAVRITLFRRLGFIGAVAVRNHPFLHRIQLYEQDRGEREQDRHDTHDDERALVADAEDERVEDRLEDRAGDSGKARDESRDGAALRLKPVADDRRHDREMKAAQARAAQDPEKVELPHVGGECGEQRADRGQYDSGEDDGAQPVALDPVNDRNAYEAGRQAAERRVQRDVAASDAQRL